VVPGWFDKFLPWRHAAIREFDKLVLLCPSAEFSAGAVAEEFAELLQGSDPLRGVTLLA
jgi:hypothetical protein